MYKVIEKETLNPTVTKMVVGTPAVAKKTLAGRFTILRVHEGGERVPLMVADCDRERGTITIISQVVSKTTTLLNQLNVGNSILDFVDLLGKPSHMDGYKRVCVIGEGVDCAIVYPTAKALHENGTEVTVITGSRNKDLVILEEELKQVSTHACLTSDGGSTGVKGLVTSVPEDLASKGESSDEVIAIGPLITMKFVCQLTKKCGIKTVVSMNPIMTDGTGVCGGYRLNVGGETKSACVDGSDFGSHLVDLDKAMSRGATCRNFEAHARDTACNLVNKEVR